MTNWIDTWDTPHVGDSGGRGQVAILRTYGFTSRLIRGITRAPVNHMIIDTGTEIIDAEFPRVRTRPYGYFTNAIWSQFDLTEAQKDKVVEFAKAQIDKPYGTLDDIAIGVGILTKEHTPGWLAKWLANNGEWICSSLADACLRHAGVHIWDDDRPVGAVPPSAFWRFFDDAKWLPKRIPFSRKV